MKNFLGKVAVITGGADGIGKAIARACAARGMKLVLADISEERLQRTVAELAAEGAEVIGVAGNVAVEADVQALADKAFAQFGKVHLLVNNAGVALAKNAWETTQADWDWVMGVNLYGVSNGLRAFVPRMLESGEEGHVVNTASVAGLISEPSMAAYNASKFAVVTLTEGLHHDLTLRKANVKASVLCPAWVKTAITNAERNRADGERQDFSKMDAVTAQTGMAIMRAVENGISPESVAEAVMKGVENEQFYILTHPHAKAGVQIRMEDILMERQPTLLPI